MKLGTIPLFAESMKLLDPFLLASVQNPFVSEVFIYIANEPEDDFITLGESL